MFSILPPHRLGERCNDIHFLTSPSLARENLFEIYGSRGEVTLYSKIDYNNLYSITRPIFYHTEGTLTSVKSLQS